MASWTNLVYSALSVLTSTKMTQLYDNITALAEGATGAPQWVNRFPARNLSGAGTFAVATDCVINWDLSGGNANLTIPAASTFKPGQMLIVRKSDSSGNVGTLVRTGTDTFDGETSDAVTLQHEVKRYIAVTGGFVSV